MEEFYQTEQREEQREKEKSRGYMRKGRIRKMKGVEKYAARKYMREYDEPTELRRIDDDMNFVKMNIWKKGQIQEVNRRKRQAEVEKEKEEKMARERVKKKIIRGI